MSTDRKLLLISPVRHPSPLLIYSTSIPICLPDPLPLVTVVFTSSNETSEAVIGSSVSSPSHLLLYFNVLFYDEGDDHEEPIMLELLLRRRLIGILLIYFLLADAAAPFNRPKAGSWNY